MGPPVDFDVSNDLQHDWDNGASKQTNDWLNGGTPTRNEVWQPQRILALDGGGIRGYSSLLILRALMTKVSELERKWAPIAQSSSSSPFFVSVRTKSSQGVETPGYESQFRPCHYFDYICGTNMGGIYAMLLGVLRLPVDEAMSRAHSIERELIATTIPPTISTFRLRGSKAENSYYLNYTLQRHLDATRPTPTDVSQAPRLRFSRRKTVRMEGVTPSMRVDDDFCRTIVFATHKPSKGVTRPFLFRSYQVPNGREKHDTSQASIVDAGRAALSDKNGFQGVRMNGIPGILRDASDSLTKPAFEAYHEVSRLHGRNIGCLLSLGVDLNFESRLERGSRSDSWPTREDDFALRAEANDYGFSYDRFADSTLTANMSFETIEARMDKYCSKHDDELETWAEILVRNRRRRAQTVEWQRYAGMVMSCQICTSERRNWTTRELFDVAQLQQHVREEHKGT